MDNTIYSENRELRRRLENLLRQARTNEKIQELFDSFGFEIIAANTPAQLRELLLMQMPARFQLRSVILVLVDYDNDIERLFFSHDENAKSLYHDKLIILDAEKEANKVDALSKNPLLGSSVLKKYTWLLERMSSNDGLESAAFLPLIRNQQIIGALLLISSDSRRYQSNFATDFLRKLSAMTAVAVENCLNQQRLKEIGYQDALTHAYNRRYFNLRFHDEVERCLRQNADIACMFLDVDYFKKVNDVYGHHIGDMVLMRMVSIIKEQVRASDIVARYGGEEFVVVLPDTSMDLAKDIAERLRVTVCRQAHEVEDKSLNISVSIGLTTLSDLPNADDKLADEIESILLERADKALYCAKKTGRNKVVVYADNLCD
jgi:diguanylate cyclase (GGDEF)-like protein